MNLRVLLFGRRRAKVTKKEYKKYTAKQLVGKKVATLVAMQNRLANIPAGTIGVITAKRGGFALKLAPCPHCGIELFITKVPPSDVCVYI